MLQNFINKLHNSHIWKMISRMMFVFYEDFVHVPLIEESSFNGLFRR
jgi:hypothetical protein